MTLKVGSICPPHGRVRGPRRGAWGRMDGWESRISSRGGLPMGAACAVLAVVAVVFRDLGAVVGAGERLVRRDEGLHLGRFRRCVGASGLRGVRGRGFLGLRCFRLFLRCGALSLGGRLGLEPGSFPDQALAVGHGPERQGPASIPFRLFEVVALGLVSMEGFLPQGIQFLTAQALSFGRLLRGSGRGLGFLFRSLASGGVCLGGDVRRGHGGGARHGRSCRPLAG